MKTLDVWIVRAIRDQLRSAWDSSVGCDAEIQTRTHNTLINVYKVAKATSSGKCKKARVPTTKPKIH